MLALNKQFDQAVRLFEAVASNACESNLLKYSAKDYFFKAAICHFWKVFQMVLFAMFFERDQNLT